MTSTETNSWSNRLSPRNWSLAWKLVAVGLVPAVLAVFLGVLRVADQARTASELGAANRLLEIRTQVADTATALRVERDRATVFLAERRLGDRGQLTEAVDRSDATIEQVRTGIGEAELDDATRAAHERSDGGLAQLAVLRSGVTGSAPLLPAQVLQRYTTIIDRVDGFDRALLRQVRTPEVAGLTDSMTAVTAASEALAVQHTVLGVALRAGAVSPDDKAAVGVTDGAYVSAFGDYQLALPTSVQQINFVTSENNAQRDAAKSAIVLSPTPGPIPITPAAWDDAVARASDDVTQAGVDIQTALVGAGETAEARSSNLAGVNSVLLMLGVLLAATIVVLVARSLTRSLRVLRTSALDVAQRRLPQAVENMRAGNAPDATVEPVPLRNRDEVGQVARAFDAVHGQALRLAADQAALQSNVSSMFVNLSRRSQGLVERQLQLIEQLESNEQDPDQLSNLFQLDHLATRMRRNSENLLVLAGTDFAKRNVAPVPLVDVLRAAVSEIEHYQRITVQAPPPATIIGRATSDVVHLLAELLDNATNFSPPESQVVMSSMRTPDGSILVEIADRGVGMLEQELADANRRLTTPSAVDVSASRRMGLFVVGRLGARHGITVHLGGAPMGGPGGGLTASVTLPAHLVSAGGDGIRPHRGEPVAPAAVANGVPPQRASIPGRPAPRTVLAATGNGQPLPQPAALNGLPTRTPGSALRRTNLASPAMADAPERAETADPAVSERPGSASDEAAEVAERPDLRPAGRPGREPSADEPGDGATEPVDADSEPTGTLPAVAATAGGTRDDVQAADALDTPPTGTRGDALPRRRTAFRPGAAGAPEGRAPDTGDDTAGRTAPDESAGPEAPAAADVERAADGVDRADGVVAAAPTGRADEAQGAGTEEADAPASEHTASERTASERTAPEETASEQAGPEHTAPGRLAADGTPAAESVEEQALPRRVSPRPRPMPGLGPNGTYRDMTVPATPFGTADAGPARNGDQNGGGQNGAARHDTDPGGASPTTTPLPVVPASDAPFGAPAASGPGAGADALFSASVPAIAEPDGLPRGRRSLGDLRRGGPVDMTETTPIFEEIASAWFASQRPVPVDWELGERPAPGPQVAPAAPAPAPAASAPPAPAPRPDPVDADAFAGATVPTGRGTGVAVEPSAFATVADEGWRAASGAAADRPDELTAAGLPKRRPRARLVPGSAGSAVLAAPASPTRSAESIRGRLASYQQGVRQGREIRLRRDPGGAGSQPATDGEDATASAGGEHDEENR